MNSGDEPNEYRFPDSLAMEVNQILRSVALDTAGQEAGFLSDPWVVESCRFDPPESRDLLVVCVRRPNGSDLRVEVDSAAYAMAFGASNDAPYGKYSRPAVELTTLLDEFLFTRFEDGRSQTLPLFGTRET